MTAKESLKRNLMRLSEKKPLAASGKNVGFLEVFSKSLSPLYSRGFLKRVTGRIFKISK
jgi:hypothetical protein